MPIKNAVYVLPSNEQTREDLQWVAREIAQEGGEATVCEANLVDGLSDEQVEALFQEAREADFAIIAEEAREPLREPPAKLKDDRRRKELALDLSRRKKRLADVIAVDFFGAPGREAAESSIAALEERLRQSAKQHAATGASSSWSSTSAGAKTKAKRSDYRGRTWVTRKNVHVDRIACAWLIRRFIDPKARLKLVPGQGYVAKKGEVTFDMFEADFTHVGDACSFETLVDRFGLRDPGLGSLAEIIHDIDVKDGKFARAEAPGIAALVAGIAVRHADDHDRFTVGDQMFDALLELYRRKRG